METLNIIEISENELFNLLVNETKSQTISLEYIVDESGSKTVKGLKQVQKQVRINNLYLNHSYTNKVINLSGDTSFQAFELKGKTRISSTIIQSDTTKNFLLDGKILNSESVKVINYFHNEEIITESEGIAKGLFTNSFMNPKFDFEKTTSGRGLLNIEDDFKMITLSLKNIIRLKFKGIEYQIKKS